MSERIPVNLPSTGRPAGPPNEQQLSRSLSMRENMLITLSAVTPATSVLIIVPAILVGVGGASVVAMLVAGAAAIFVGLCRRAVRDLPGHRRRVHLGPRGCSASPPASVSSCSPSCAGCSSSAAYFSGYLHACRGDRWTLPDPIHEDEPDAR